MSKDIEISMKLTAMAAALDDLLQEEYGKRVGFALIVAPFGQANGTQVQYASNIDSTSSQEILRTILHRLENKLPNVSHHVKH